ncbi:MAG: SDR family NAD(P)-dependent oxidoreductase [Deltaproteobacteria bacterium]|nr:SDR family NAD(P)-dependent oxidoreductase [Deltaproteobacteria bacterium]
MIGSFDRIGFERHRRHFHTSDLDVDLAGRTALVTGGNSGLGFATAQALARLGAHVVIACRDGDRGARACAQLRESTGSRRIELALLDVSSLDAVRDFTAMFAPSKLDILVHNAGLLPEARALTRDGLELTFATHVVGPHLLTAGLRPKLAESPDARIVFVSSGGMYTQRLDLEDLTWERRTYDGVRAYAQTKRMQVVLATRWSEALRGTTAHVYAMHPGWADTPGVVRSLPVFHALTRAVLRTSAEGADTIVWLCAVARPPEATGGFFFDRRQVREHLLPWTRETAAQRDELWRMCQSFVGEEVGT